MKKTKQQLIELGQGERLKEFREGKGFRSRNKFAKFVKVGTSTINAIEWNQNEISELISNEIKKAFPELNIKWLLAGELPKLLTENLKLRIVDNIEEARIPYDQNCPFCAEKDKKIESLRSQLEILQQEYIECLKEVSALRKAASG